MIKRWITVICLFLLSLNKVIAQKIELVIKTGHENSVVHANLSPDETKLFTVDRKFLGILWDIPSGRQLRTYTKVVNGGFKKNGQTLLLELNNGIFKEADLTGNVVKVFPGEPGGENIISPSSAIYPDLGLVTWNSDLINISTGLKISMQCPEYESRSYAPAAGIMALGGDKGTVSICNGLDGKILKRMDLGFGYGEQRIQFLNFAADGNIFLAACGEYTNTVKIVDYAGNKEVQSVKLKGSGGFRLIQWAELAPDGKTFIVLTENKVKLYNVSDGVEIWSKPNVGNYTSAIFSEKGTKIILNGAVKQIGIISQDNGSEIATLTSIPLDNPITLFVTPDNSSILSGTSDNKIIDWNLIKGSVEKSLTWALTPRADGEMTPDRKKVIRGGYDKGKSYLSEMYLAVPGVINHYPPSDGGDQIYRTGVSFDGKYVYSSSAYFNHKPNEETKNLEIYDVASRKKVLGFKNSLFAGGFAKTKDIIAVKPEKKDPTINFYDVPSGKLQSQIIDPHIEEGAQNFLFSNKDKYLSVENYRGNSNSQIALIELATKKYIPVDMRFRDYISSYAFTPDDKYIVLGGADGEIDIFNILTQKFTTPVPIRAYISSFIRGVSGITFSKDGRFMFLSGGEKTIQVWNFATRTLVATLYSFSSTDDWAVITPDGHFDASPGAQESMYFVRGINTIALADLYEKFYTPQLLVRILSGERLAPIDVDINTMHPRPVVKIKYTEKSRNLTVVGDNTVYTNATGVAEITVNASAENDKVDEIRLFHNGKVVNLATRGLFVTDNSAGNSTKTYTVNLLPGANTIRALALNSQRTESRPDEITVNYQAAGAAQADGPVPINITAGGAISLVDKNATLYLVVVGINKYKNPAMSLNYALADATAFKDEAEKDAQSEVTNIKTYFITDEKADKAGITAAFAEVQKLARPQDVFVFYYAGHGVISEKNKDFYLVPNDVADLKNVDAALELHGIPSHALQKYAIDIAAQKQVFILDACQSAGAFATLLTDNGNQQKSLSVVARSTGTHWIAASGSQQFANEFSQLGHGAFTYVLLKAMGGEAANNKMITVNGLKNFLQLGVPDLMKKYNGTPQYPASYGFGNDFPVEVMK
jgi:WD40 repeat protein